MESSDQDKSSDAFDDSDNGSSDKSGNKSDYDIEFPPKDATVEVYQKVSY